MKSKLAHVSLVAVLFAAVCAMVTWAAVPRRTVTETLLRTVGLKRAMGELGVLVSPDGAHTAWVERAKGGATVFLDRKAVGTHAGVMDPWIDMRFAAIVPGLVFSNTGGRLAYAIVDGKHVRVVVGGTPGRPYDKVGLPVFSADGKKIAYAARIGDRWFVVVDGREGKRYDGISSGLGSPVIFSPDGKVVAYTANIGDKNMTVVNGRELPPCSRIRDLVFSRDGGHYAFASSDKGFSVIKDGRPIPGAYRRFRLSPDGKRIAYYVFKNDGYHLTLDGKSSKPYKTALRDAAFSPDSKRFAFAATPYNNRYGREMLVVDGKESKQLYGSVSSITFSPDSKRLACCVTLNTVRRVLVDGRIVSISGLPRTPVFSPDSKRLAFMIGSSIALDGKQVGKPGYYYSGPPVFSPDSRHVLCAARRDNGESISIDGIPGRSYDVILESAVFFDAPNRFHYFARRGGNVYRVDEKM